MRTNLFITHPCSIPLFSFPIMVKGVCGIAFLFLVYIPKLDAMNYYRESSTSAFYKYGDISESGAYKVISPKGERQILQNKDDIAFEISGRVTDANGQPLVGVTIKLKNGAIGTTTDANGHYSLEVPNGKGTLVFSYIGYTTQEVTISERNVINVELISNTSRLNELVVTGYTSQRKKDILGSVAVVNMKAIKSLPATTVDQALQGQAAGVTVIGSGQPDGTPNIFIRGITSFGDNSPLVIVDGVQGSMHDLNINNIASIQVLKDAGAAAIYGVRGSNGVIIITTKKGSEGPPTVSYNASVGLQVPPSGNVLNIASPSAMAAFVNKLNPGQTFFANGIPQFMYAGPNGILGVGNAGDPAVAPSNYVFDPSNPANDYLIQRFNLKGTDWFHQVFKPAFTQRHTLTISGGSKSANYLFSLGYLNQQGTLIATYLKRYSVRINTEFTIKNKIKVGENAYVFYKSSPPFSNQNQDNAIFFAYTEPPFIPVYNIKGQYGGTWEGPDLNDRWNPVALQLNTESSRGNTWEIFGNMYAETDFLTHFNIRTSFGGTVANMYDYTFSPNRYQDYEQHTLPNVFDESAAYTSNWIWTNTITYNQVFGNNSIKLLGGSESIHNYGRSVGGSSTGLFSNDLNYLVLSNGTSNITNFSNASTDNLYSLFGRLDYSFKDKYLISATIRRDGSSRFGSLKKYGVFPSFSAGWRISDEEFMKNIRWINDLKIRGSWGKMGSQNNVPSTNAFTLYSSRFAASYYDIAGSGSLTQGFYQSAIGNPNTGWEQDIVTNIGLDASLFNDRVDFSVEWYKKATNGLLFPQPLPATAGGATAPIINIGDVENKGVDAVVTYHGGRAGGFSYTLQGEFTSYKNLIVSIPNPGYFDVGNVRNEVGHPMSSFFGYKSIGFFQDSEDVAKSPVQQDAAPGRFKFEDVNHDGKITTADRTFVGNPNPKFTYGLNLSAGFKGFDFSMILYGSYGNQVDNSLESTLTHWGDYMEAISNDMVYDSWTPTNPHPKAPIAENATTFSSYSGSFNVENGSFLKCRSIEVGYSFKPSWLKRTNLKNLRIYIQGSNLFDITKYTGLDPELSGPAEDFGIDLANYPNNFKNYIFGVNVSF